MLRKRNDGLEFMARTRKATATIGGLVLVAVCLLSCKTAPIVIEPDFRGIHEPDSGLARIYLMRPAFHDSSHKLSPIFKIDNRDDYKLTYGSYAEIQLAAGVHHLAVRPGEGGAIAWTGDYDFTLDPDRVYFVAVWNDIEIKSGTGFIPVLGAHPFFLPSHYTIAHELGLRIEIVSKEDAMPVLKEMRFSGTDTVR
jgi:hypothetical protein